MTFNVAKYSAFARGLFLLLLLSLFLTGCVGGKQSIAPTVQSAEAPVDSLKALFSLTIYSPDGKTQDLDAVLFSVPNKRYRMELTGTLGIGLESVILLCSLCAVLEESLADETRVEARHVGARPCAEDSLALAFRLCGQPEVQGRAVIPRLRPVGHAVGYRLA